MVFGSLLVASDLPLGDAQARAADQAIPIGSRRELMVDDYLIDRMHGVELRLHHPKAREVALVFDKPWEGNTGSSHNVFRDGGMYRMYYRGSDHPSPARKGPHMTECYAESKDGIH